MMWTEMQSIIDSFLLQNNFLDLAPLDVSFLDTFCAKTVIKILVDRLV